MSMEITTIMEMVQVFTAYALVSLVVPYIVLHRLLQEKELTEKFIICITISNFYYINIIFLMFFLHIPGKFTLLVLTLVPAFIAWQQINQPDVIGFFHVIFISVTRLFLGETKFFTLRQTLLKKPKRCLKGCFIAAFSHIQQHLLEWIFFLTLMGYNAYYFGYQSVVHYGYAASDVVVHQYWINEMIDGTIFVKGIYPFGFHNIMYYLHTIFNISTTSLLRSFGMIETLYICAMIYVLLKKICKSKYIPLLGLLIFTLPDLCDPEVLMRYQSALPQEYGMIFLYPCAYFLIQYFERKKEEINIEKELRQKKILYTWLELYHLRPSTRSLILFAINFSLTLAAHFYITIIAFVLCFAIAIAYFPIVFHYRYLVSIAVAGILSVSSAVLPMAMFFALGTPLQGSLGWAIDIIAGNSEKAKEDSSVKEINRKLEPYIVAQDGNFISYDISNAENKEELIALINAQLNGETVDSDTTIKIKQDTKQHTQETNDSSLTLLQKLSNNIKIFANNAQTKLLSFNTLILDVTKKALPHKFIRKIILYGSELLCAVSLLLILIRRKYYFRNIFFLSLYTFLFVVLYCSIDLGLPSLMEEKRTIIFTVYAIPLLVAGIADFIYTLGAWPFKYRRYTEVVPILASLLLTYAILAYDFVKPLSMQYAIFSKGEMYCNYQIMKDYPDKSWTVVTTTNSLQILKDHGWHMEIATFLRGMHYFTPSTRVTIPTKYVFFYIEKYPINYGLANSITEPLDNTGFVSAETADQDTIYTGGSIYDSNNGNRHKLESKMYYWAKAFQEQYPQEFQIYYEDESFICYRIIQNEFRLYNFAIDYRYN